MKVGANMPWPKGHKAKDQIISIRLTADDLAKLKKKARTEEGEPSARQMVQRLVQKYLERR